MSWHERQVVLANTYVSSSNLALSVEQFVARTTETIDLSLRFAIGELASGAVGPREMQVLLAERVRQSPQISSLTVIGADGRVVASSLKLAPREIDVAQKDYFLLARDSAGLRFSVDEPPRLPLFHRQRAIYVSRRISRPDGSFGGVIAATLNQDYVMRFFYTLNIGEKGIIALNTTDGVLLVGRPYAEDLIGRSFRDSVLFQGMLPWASSGVFPMQYQVDGLWRIVGYQRVERLPLLVQVALSRDEALTNWWHTMLMQAAAGIALLAVIAAMAYALNRELAARMRAHAQLSHTVGELEKARRAAEESSRVKSQFMANMSHELRTPLNAIIGFSEVIRDALVGPVAARYREYARDILASGQHLLGLINDVLDLTKIELGRLDLHEGPVDLVKLTADCRRLLADRLHAGSLEFSLELPPDLPLLKGDELRLRQIVLNLLSNAVKFTPAGGRIALAVERDAGGRIRLSVADTGIGMKPEEIPLALEPFRQLDSELNRRYEGTGLGLPLARTLAELHGGSLDIISAPGKGTTVTLTLPRDRIIRQAA